MFVSVCVALRTVCGWDALFFLFWQIDCTLFFKLLSRKCVWIC